MVPKYRCWDERVGLTEVVSIDFFRKKIKINHWEYGNSNFFPLDEVVLMQSTGLKDKNGVEIFEGDVVICLGPDLEETFSTVAFAEGAFCVNHKHLGVEFEFLYFVDSAMEVIGNIYENPELLEPDYEN